MSRIHFYTTFRDIEGPLERVERLTQLKYTLCGNHESPDVESFASFREIGGYGTNPGGQLPQCRMFLVTKAARVIRPYEVVLRKTGQSVFTVDQFGSHHGVVLNHGGRANKECIIAGELSTIYTEEEALWIFKQIKRELSRSCTRVGRYLVGPEALAFLNAGGRLTHGVKFPVENDLTDPL